MTGIVVRLIFLILVILIIIWVINTLSQLNVSNDVPDQTSQFCSLNSKQEHVVKVSSSDTILNSIQAGLDSVQCEYVKTLIIELEGVGPYQLPADFSLFPTSLKCETIIIRGDTSNALHTSVDVMTATGPFDSWNRLQTVDGMVAGEYEYGNIYNITKHSYSVIDTNDSATLDVINGNKENLKAWLGWGFEDVNILQAFSEGDELLIYHPSTIVSFSGVTNIQNSSRLIFERLILDGDVKSSLQSSNGDARVTIRGSKLNVRSTIEEEEDFGFLIGSFKLEGVYAKSEADNTQLVNGEPNVFHEYRSIYCNGPRIVVRSDTFIFFIKMKNTWQRCILVNNSHLTMYSADLYGSENCQFWGGIFTLWYGGNAKTKSCHFTQMDTSQVYLALIGMDSLCNLFMEDSSFYADGFVEWTMFLESDCIAKWFNTGYTQGTYGVKGGIVLQAGCQFDDVRPKEFIGITSLVYYVDRLSKLIMINGDRFIDNDPDVPIMLLTRMSDFTVFATQFIYNGNPGVPVIDVAQSSSANLHALALTNNLGPAEVRVGAQGIIPYGTSINDFALPNTQHAYLTIM